MSSVQAALKKGRTDAGVSGIITPERTTTGLPATGRAGQAALFPLPASRGSGPAHTTEEEDSVSQASFEDVLEVDPFHENFERVMIRFNQH